MRTESRHAHSFVSGVSHTFSMVAVDPESAMCGACVASMYPAVGKVVPFARAGVGAFCTQHHHHAEWGPTALTRLASPGAAMTCLTPPR